MRTGAYWGYTVLENNTNDDPRVYRVWYSRFSIDLLYYNIIYFSVLNIQSDVAGATLMAAGSSAPELATSVIAVFIAKVSVTFKIDQNKIVI